MLEILLLIGLWKGMGSVMSSKGRNPLLLQIFAVVGWIGGEIAGAIVGVVMHHIKNGPDVEPGFEVYVFALVGAAIGAGIPFVIAFVLPHAKSADHYLSQGGPSRPIDPNNPYAS